MPNISRRMDGELALVDANLQTLLSEPITNVERDI